MYRLPWMPRGQGISLGWGEGDPERFPRADDAWLMLLTSYKMSHRRAGAGEKAAI